MAIASRWTGLAQNGEWSDGRNWIGGVPTAGRDAVFADGGAWFLCLAVPPGAMPDKVGTLEISADAITFHNGVLDFLPAVQSNGPTYDLTLNAGASLTVGFGARLSGDQTMALGQDGSATRMLVLGVVAENFGYVQGGRLVVAGSGRWISGASGIQVGGVGQGQLIVSAGGVVSEGSSGFSEPAAQLSLGDGFGSGKAVVTGAGSRLALTEVYVGGAIFGGYSGRLTISNGGEVIDEVGVISDGSDGYVTVTGKGSRWINLDHLAFGQTVPTDSALTVVNSGEVDWGASGFYLNDKLRLDGSAVLHGRLVVDGGQIDALGGRGDVTIGANIEIATNWLFQNQELAALASEGGVALRLTGKISGDGASILYAGAGHIVLSDAANAYGSTEIYSGRLEVAATGALGRGAVSFVGSPTTAATLQLDAGVKLANAIDNFSVPDAVDLRGLAYSSALHATWSENASHTGGALTILGGAAAQTLTFGDTFAANDFVILRDGHGGAMIMLGASPLGA